jgi:Uncharacterized conserved protein
MKVYNKLVRDKIPKIIIDNGEKPIIRILLDYEYEQELLKKLNEEYEEVLSAKENDDLIEECADMLEVLLALIELKGYNMEDLLRTREEKNIKRGGFKQKIFLESVDKE